MSSAKRIAKELADVEASPISGMTITVPDSDLRSWSILLEGPTGTPYAGGYFHLALSLPSDYPFKPPTIKFVTRIYHPNVTNDDKGSMCIGMLKADNWKPSSRITAILGAARNLLQEPNFEDSVEQTIASEWRDNRAEFERKANEYTVKYASKK